MEFKGTKDLEFDNGMLVGYDILVCEMIDFNKENEANVKLFLAAPDLLEALIEVTRESDCPPYIQAMAQQAINKAINK